MGYYINITSKNVPLPACDKADYIILDGGKEINTPDEFVSNLICVVENGPFDAALYCYSKNEFEMARNPLDKRPKRWIVHPMAAKLSGYNR